MKRASKPKAGIWSRFWNNNCAPLEDWKKADLERSRNELAKLRAKVQRQKQRAESATKFFKGTLVVLSVVVTIGLLSVVAPWVLTIIGIAGLVLALVNLLTI